MLRAKRDIRVRPKQAEVEMEEKGLFLLFPLFSRNFMEHRMYRRTFSCIFFCEGG